MNKTYILLFFSLFSFSIFAQKTTIRGRVLDKSKEPLVGANIFLRDTYDGATSDVEGNFQFDTEESSAQVLLVKYVGYDSVSQQVNLKGGIFEFNPVLRESFNELKVVVITAGSFEASDERKVTVLKPLDIVTTASAGGDTYGALKTLPGAQVSSGDQEGLFVRGGSGTEAQTFIDGMLVRTPFTASTPDYAARGRFSPFLFKGTVFSTGGYSAQYGQGMSSALILDSQDLPERSAGTLAVSCVGLGFGRQKLWKDKGRAIGGSINYTNLGPYFSLVKQRPDFTHKPEYIGTEGFFRQKTGQSGLLKFYGYYNTGRVGFNTKAPSDSIFSFDVKNANAYTNLSWVSFLNEHWKINLGSSFSHDRNDIATTFNMGILSPDTFNIQNSLTQVRAVATRFFGRLTTLRFGGEYQYATDDFKSERGFGSGLRDHYGAIFAESDLYVTTKLVARLGLRGERSSLLSEARLSPRVSLAYKLTDASQVSFAWGHFYQKGDSLLRWRGDFSGAIPGFQKAEHFILNYQYIKNDRTVRIEGFYKKYEELVTTRFVLANDGKGYAKGLELFYRDKKTFRGVDYWLSYSWLDTKRKFQWYPSEAQPTFAANHVATLVAKKYFPKIRTSVGLAYNFATGRPYYNPDSTIVFLSQRTPAYNNLSINASYLTTVRKAFAVFVLGVTNVLNQEQIFGYRFPPQGGEPVPIKPAANQFFFVGAFFSWGTDRRQEVLDNQN
ncbi:MAG: TonB-dependent receptor [Phycisphaerae bacterium]|nr:TonB-dependent receptor [Saprospiraceae bacterium]